MAISDHQVSNYDDLYNALDRYQAGDEVEVKVLRMPERKTHAVRVRLKLLDN